MSYEVKKLEKSMVEIQINVDGQDAKDMVSSVVKDMKNKVEVPGFRKGKVPEYLIMERFKGAIDEEVAQKLIEMKYTEILDSEKINPVDYLKLKEIKIEKEKICAVYIVEVYPEVKVGQYKGLEVEKAKVEINEEAVEKEVASLIDKNSKLKEIEEGSEAKLDDVVSIDFEGFMDGEAFEGGKGENFDLKLGSKSFIGDFEEQLVGTKVGDEMDVNVSFPETYFKKELASKPALFKVKVNAIKRVETSELNDEFAKELGFENLDDLKAAKKIELEQKEEANIEHGYINAILEKIKAGSELEIPRSLIARETEYRMKELENQLKTQGASLDMYLKMQNLTVDALKSDLLPLAEEKVRMDIILDEIAKMEKVEITEEEIEERFAEVAKQYEMEVEKLKEQLKKVGNYDNFLNSLKAEKITKKTIDLIVSETIEK